MRKCILLIVFIFCLIPTTQGFSFDWFTGVPPGSDTEIPFNDSGQWGADTTLLYEKSTDTLKTVNAFLTDSGALSFYDDGNDTSVVIGPVTDGTTTLPITGSIDVSGTVSGATYGSDGSISDAELLGIDDGATTEIPVGGGSGSPMVWTTATGTGAPVRANNPVLIAPSLGDATATSITIDPSAIPAIELTDSNTTDEDTGVRFYGNATATGTGVEVYDWAIGAQGAATAGTMGDVVAWTGSSKIFILAGSMAVSTADVTCTDADDVCIYNATKAQLWITAGTDATGDTMTVTAGSVAGETRTFTLVGGTDDVTIDVSSGTDSTLTGASGDSVTYRWDLTNTTWMIIAGVGL